LRPETPHAERAKIGVPITLTDPTTTMRREATAAGFYQPETKFEGERDARKYPKIQILTVEDLFENRRPETPYRDESVFKKAKREKTEKQDELDL
jgi:site-specific DNA-methyltransferase (adenine-specific)